jgi:hypothetical protein
LREALEARKQRLAESEKAHQFLYDCNEAEAWMSEQELYMMQVIIRFFKNKIEFRTFLNCIFD